MPEAASILSEQVMVEELVNNYATTEFQNEFNHNTIYAILCSEPGIMQLDKITASASKTSDGWNLSGKKMISKEQLNADEYIVFAKDEENKIRVFKVEKQNISLSTVTKSVAGSEIVLNRAELDVNVPENSNIAVINDNYEKNITIARTLIAAAAVGIANSAIIAGINAVKETKDSEKNAVSNSQSVQFTLADMYTEFEAGKVLTYLSADMIDNNKPSIKYATMAKVQATDAASSISLQSMQLLGNIGYLINNDFADIFQFTVSEQIKGGTNRVQKNQIYQYMLAKK